MWTSARTFITTGLVALTIAGTALATASQAEAHNNFGRGLVTGIAGAVVGSALLAGATHSAAYGAPTYGPPPMAYGPPPMNAYAQSCHVVWKRNDWGDMYRARICD